MSKKKGKFDLTELVHHGLLKEDEKLFFVSDPSKFCQIKKMPNHEFKVIDTTGVATTVHAFAQACLGMEPPEHASKWLRTASNKTLYEIWHSEDQAA